MTLVAVDLEIPVKQTDTYGTWTFDIPNVVAIKNT